MDQPPRQSESPPPADDPPLAQELAGLPELDRFASESDRAAALRAVHRRLEDPYTASYWFWVAVLVCAAAAAYKLVSWSLHRIGAPSPFPTAVGVVAALGAYMLLYRALIRWAAGPELQRELAERGIPLDASSNAGGTT